MTDLIRDLEEKINFLRRQAEEYKAKIKPVPKEWAGLSSQGQVNLDLRKKVKYFYQKLFKRENHVYQGLLDNNQLISYFINHNIIFKKNNSMNLKISSTSLVNTIF